jgi:hypothetical protein
MLMIANSGGAKKEGRPTKEAVAPQKKGRTLGILRGAPAYVTELVGYLYRRTNGVFVIDLR